MDDSYRIESINGVMQGPYTTRAAAKAAADRSNEIAPEQRWRVVPESEYPRN